MRRILFAAAAIAVAAVTLSGCSGSAVTATRLDQAVGPAFARLYVDQARTRGSSVVRTPDGYARCARADKSHRDSGAGDDWSCVVNFPYPDGHIQPISYDLSVTPAGCYTADGPVQVVGAQRITAADGHTVTNPLFQFDGCFDLH